MQINSLYKEILMIQTNKEYLNALIKRQIINCIINENYRAGAFVVFKVHIEMVTNIIKEIIENCGLQKYLADIRPIVVTSTETRITFSNGSCIRITNLTEGRKGMRLNDIIYDISLDEELVDVIVRPMFVSYELLTSDKKLDRRLKIVGFEL